MIMSPWILALFFTFMALLVPHGDAVKCFECNSERNYDCGDPFNYNHYPLIDCERKGIQPQSQSYLGSRSVCKKTKQRINGLTIVERTCAWEQSYGGDLCANSYNNQGYGYTEHCSTCAYDACNGAANAGPGYWLLSVSGILYASVKCL